MYNKIIVIGPISYGKSSIINLLGLEIMAQTSPKYNDNETIEYTITNGDLKNVKIYDTKGLDDSCNFIESSASQQLDNFINDKKCLAKIVFYTLDNSQPYINKENLKNIKLINEKINKANNKGD